MADLQDQFISDSFPSLLHVNRPDGVPDAELPITGLGLIQDGSGNNSALLLGRSGQGATINGSLSVLGTNNNISGTNTLIRSSLITLSGSNLNRIIGVGNIIQGTNTINGNTTFNGGNIIVNGDNTAVNTTLLYTKNISCTGGIVTDVSFRAGGLFYPVTGGVAQAGKIPVVNSGGTALILQNLDQNSVGSTDPNVILQTVFVDNPYSTGAGTAIVQFTIQGDGATWTPVTIPGFTIASGYTAGIFMLEYDVPFFAERLYTKIVASPIGNTDPQNKQRIFPVWNIVGGENESGDAIKYGFGCQFSCPITPGTSNGTIYFRKDNSRVDPSPDTGPDKFKLYIIARMK